MTLDPYRELGVTKSATNDSVRRAWKRKAKRTHPDAGGNATEFQRARLAYNILSDESRRAAYDETGRIEEPSPDETSAKALNIVAAAIENVLQVCEQRGMDPTSVDIIADAVTGLKNGIDQMREQERKAKAAAKRAIKLRGKFSAKKGIDRITPLVEARIRQLELAAWQAAEGIKPFEMAVEILSDHTFKWSEYDSRYGEPFVGTMPKFIQFAAQ